MTKAIWMTDTPLDLATTTVTYMVSAAAGRIKSGAHYLSCASYIRVVHAGTVA